MAEISSLLSALEEAAGAAAAAPAPPAIAAPRSEDRAKSAPPAPPRTDFEYAAAPPMAAPENTLVQVRLGLASALFAALRLRRPEIASHSLRVALGCSTWALYKRLDDETRDVAEVAALLHDLGAIGAPDGVTDRQLQEADADPSASWRRAQAGLDVLCCCCSSKRVLDAVRYTGLRFDGVGAPPGISGDTIPVESRMIAIVDAFDAMTAAIGGSTALSRDQAMLELQKEAGLRFDPILVGQFVEVLGQQQAALSEQLVARWFSELGKRQAELPWQPEASGPAAASSLPSGRSCFEQQLIDSMHDGVAFVDASARILMWSKGAERLTGVSSTAATGRQLKPSLLDMCNATGRRVRDDGCPVARALAGGSQLRQRLEILGRSGTHVVVDLHAVPVTSPNGDLLGATVLLCDAQGEASLEEKYEALHAEVTKDPLTKVANRAEFDRMLALFVETHHQAGMPFSLMMCDIDHFKSINDTYGHQAGDEAILAVATLLRELCRRGDLVARYGGEEFAVLCADCTVADAAQRAEQIRRLLSETPHAHLGNKRLTASFGVTQLQQGDLPETMLGRADRALLKAKGQGRNQVVQLGNGMDQQLLRKKRWWSLGAWRTQPLCEVRLSTEVPLNIAIEKLRGFVSDHKAKVVSTRDSRVEIEVSTDNIGQHRRSDDRLALFRVVVELSERREQRTNNLGMAAGSYVETEAKVSIRPKKTRNRRQAEQLDRSRLIVQALKAYLMARELTAPAGSDAESARPTANGAK